MDRVRQPSEEASHGANKAAERAPGGLLTELAGGESKNETFNQDSAQVLIAATLTRGRRAAVYQRVDPRRLIGPTWSSRRDLPPDRLAAAPSPKCQVVGVRDVSQWRSESRTYSACC